jgi:hypothetical protein
MAIPAVLVLAATMPSGAALLAGLVVAAGLLVVVQQHTQAVSRVLAAWLWRRLATLSPDGGTDGGLRVVATAHGGSLGLEKSAPQTTQNSLIVACAIKKHAATVMGSMPSMRPSSFYEFCAPLFCAPAMQESSSRGLS